MMNSSTWREEHIRILRENPLIKEKSSTKYSKRGICSPVPKDQIRRIVSSSVTHIGNLCNAIDFLVPEGTEVYTAAEGMVTALNDDSNIGGSDSKYWYEGNYVVIKHNHESAGYEHFRYKDVAVEVGDRVKQGQLIGYSGNTGHSRGPHLHFEVMEFFGPGDEGYVTPKARFNDFHDVYDTYEKE